MTIVGERLELSRFRNPSRFAILVFAVLVVAYLLGAASTLLAFLFDTAAEIRSTETGERFESLLWKTGQVIIGLSGVGMSIWLVRHDLARTSLKRPGLARYTAACLLMGYFWLAISGLTGVLAPGEADDPHGYEAQVDAHPLGRRLAARRLLHREGRREELRVASAPRAPGQGGRRGDEGVLGGASRRAEVTAR